MLTDRTLSRPPGGRKDPLVEYEFEEIRAAIQFDKEIAANVGWSSLVKTPGNRRRLRIMIAIAFFSQWSGNNLMCVVLVSRDCWVIHRLLTRMMQCIL